MKKELLIFGASGALGKGASEVFLQKDYDKIFLFDSKTEVNIKHEKVETVKVKDLTLEANVADAFKSVKPGNDKVFFLFNTIGGYFGGKNIWETEVIDFEKMFNMNLMTSFLIAKHFSLLVKNSAGGSILFTAAFTGTNPEAKKAAYGASKAALIHLVKTLALEGKEIKLTANAITPLVIDTPANRKWIKGDYDSFVKPAEIGELVHGIFNNFNFVTGNIIQLAEKFSIE